MSKITNDGLTPSGTGRFIAVLYPYGNSGRRRVNAAHRCRSQGGQGHMSPHFLEKIFCMILPPILDTTCVNF